MIFKLLLENTLYIEFDTLNDAEELLFANGQKHPFIAAYTSLKNGVLFVLVWVAY